MKYTLIVNDDEDEMNLKLWQIGYIFIGVKLKTAFDFPALWLAAVT